MASRDERLSRIDRAVGTVSVQADCSFAEARALMISRMTGAGPTLYEMAEEILDHVIRFDFPTA
jgi:hypothetical protein